MGLVWDTVKGAVQDLIEDNLKSVGLDIDTIASALQLQITSIAGDFTMITDQLLTFEADLTAYIDLGLQSAYNEIYALQEAVTLAVLTLEDQAYTYIDQGLQALQGAYNASMDTVNEALESAMATLTSSIEALGDDLISDIAGVKGLIGESIATAEELVAKGIEEVKGLFDDLTSIILDPENLMELLFNAIDVVW